MSDWRPGDALYPTENDVWVRPIFQYMSNAGSENYYILLKGNDDE